MSDRFTSLTFHVLRNLYLSLSHRPPPVSTSFFSYQNFLTSFTPAETFLLFGAFPDPTSSVITPIFIRTLVAQLPSAEICRGRKGQKQAEEVEKANWQGARASLGKASRKSLGFKTHVNCLALKTDL